MGTLSQTYALIVPLFSEYTRTLTFEIFHQVRERFRNASVAVLGSTQPWYEAMALTEGARRVVTVQHNAVSYRHPHPSHSLSEGNLDLSLSLFESKFCGFFLLPAVSPLIGS